MQPKALLGGRLGAIVRTLQRELNGERAVSDIRRLTEWNRTPGSTGYRAAAQFAAAALRQAGLTNVAVPSFPMDGRTSYNGWTSEPAWDVTGAEIRVISPTAQELANWETDPIAVHRGSWGTPKGGVRAQVVDVGEGVSETDYIGGEIAGNVVLSFGPTQRVYDEAVRKRGALGVLSYHMPWECPEIGRTPLQLPDLVSQGRLRVDLSDEARGFAFSISRRRAEELKELLGQGPVALHCRIDGGPIPGSFDVVTGRIPGTGSPEKEFVVVAHLCHPSPGANDNASGVALGIELARCLVAAQRGAHTGAPRCSVRFTFVPEIIGLLAFLSSGFVESENVIGGVNLDMVGASQSITKSPLLLENTPWSLPTYLFDLGDALLSLGRPSHVDGQWAYRAVPFEGGSDNIVFNDSGVGSPMVGFGYRADPCYHSNLDVWTNMDATILKNVGVAAGGLAWVAATMDAQLAGEVLGIVANARQGTRTEVPLFVRRATIESIRRRSLNDPAIDAVVEQHLSQLEEEGVPRPDASPGDSASLTARGLSSGGRPIRVVSSLVWPPINGAGAFLAQLPADHDLRRRMEGYGYISTYRCVYELLNLSNGQRTWLDVLPLVVHQFEGASREDVVRLASLLLDAGALEEIGGEGR